MSVDNQKKKSICRSDLFILAAHSEGLCLALRQVVPTGLKPGKTLIALLKKLYKDFVSRTSGGPIENFPEVTDEISGFDALVIAESIHSMLLLFLTPEETEEYNESFGFRSKR